MGFKEIKIPELQHIAHKCRKLSYKPKTKLIFLNYTQTEVWLKPREKTITFTAKMICLQSTGWQTLCEEPERASILGLAGPKWSLSHFLFPPKQALGKIHHRPVCQSLFWRIEAVLNAFKIHHTLC